MSVIKGFNGSVKAGSTPSTVGEVKNWNITINQDVVETSVLGDSWADNTGTLKRWTGSLTAHVDVGDAGQGELEDALINGTSVALELYAGGESGAGNRKYAGTAIIESTPIINDVAGVVEITFSFTGTGALTPTNLV